MEYEGVPSGIGFLLSCYPIFIVGFSAIYLYRQLTVRSVLDSLYVILQISRAIIC
jgi:hypothetical protein